MRIGFLTGSITKIGSGRTEAMPLARAFSKLGCPVYGLETTRFRSRRAMVESLEVRLEPLAPYLVTRSLQTLQGLRRKRLAQGQATDMDSLRPSELAAGDAVISLANGLNLDVVYAFHNTNVTRVLQGWPHSSRLLAINLIGFGIDPSRGGAADTFPLQQSIFAHPYWDLHIAATKFEFEQYAQVYEQLRIAPQKLMHLPHSYDEELFRPPTRPDAGLRLGTDRTQKMILYPVNVYPRKNIELAIDMLGKLNREIDCKLVVTGSIWDSPYRSQLVQRANEQGIGDKVEFLGGVSIDRLLQMYHQADVTIYTSHQETFGHGIVESLGCGTPVVGPNWIHPCLEILNDSPGGWAAPKDPSGFAAVVLEATRAEPSPWRLAAAAQARYGNIGVATRFLERCGEIRAQKDKYAQELGSINWKGLYRDAGNLLQ